MMERVTALPTEHPVVTAMRVMLEGKEPVLVACTSTVVWSSDAQSAVGAPIEGGLEHASLNRQAGVEAGVLG
jgi:hypothetical protein